VGARDSVLLPLRGVSDHVDDGLEGVVVGLQAVLAPEVGGDLVPEKEVDEGEGGVLVGRAGWRVRFGMERSRTGQPGS